MSKEANVLEIYKTLIRSLIEYCTQVWAPMSRHGNWFGLVGFYGTSNIVGYLMPNPFFIHINISISNNSVKHN